MFDRQEMKVAERFTNCVRALAADGVEKAKSGHPGLPLGAADIMYVLWQKHLRFNPADPSWINRDRFILSAGHGSILLYSLLHIYGFDVSLDDLKNFRQLASKTPGHPEFGITPGVETSTGPLGQGIGNAVGMAIGYEHLRTKLTSNGYSPLDHKIFVLCGDGDLMEGISYEAASMAGHLGLSNLVVIYDDNNITIEGNTGLTFSEDVEARFKAARWEVLRADGHDLSQIDEALTQARAQKEKPVLIIAKTTIAKGSPNFAGSHKAHGAPLGSDEISKIKRNMGLPENESFCVFKDVEDHAKGRVAVLKNEYEEWRKRFNAFMAQNPNARKTLDEFNAAASIDLKELSAIDFGKGPVATRVASGIIMQYIAGKIPSFIGGAADLGPSTGTFLKAMPSFAKTERMGKNIHFGVREHVMGAVTNGLALYANYLPFCSTFLIFSDYMKPAIRLAALMKLHTVYVFSHDSFYVGEDGPTHQPIEQIWGLRSIPGLDVIRPCDAQETAAAWAQAVNNDKNPTALILSRQNLPQIDRSKYASADNLSKGGYIIAHEQGGKVCDIIVIASGSEVAAALELKDKLAREGKTVRVISMPSVEIFERQEKGYRDAVLPRSCTKRVIIEAGISGGWHKFAGTDGLVISIDRFGASAPANVLGGHYGFTTEKILERVKAWL